MVQEFSEEVGQVAGRDVKANSAQANVSVHIHAAEPKPDVTKFITEKQRTAIARKAFEIQEKTGTEKLMVYRRLMTVFRFGKIEEMPRDVYSRAIAYMDGWLKNGTTGSAQTQPSLPKTDTRPQQAVAVPSVDVSTLTAVRPVATHQQPAAEAQPIPHASQPLPRGSRPRAVLVAVAAVGVLLAVAGLHIVTSRQPAAATAPDVVTDTSSLHCEYDGRSYTVGSIVKQAGIRAECAVTAEHGLTWRPVSGGKQR